MFAALRRIAPADGADTGSGANTSIRLGEDCGSEACCQRTASTEPAESAPQLGPAIFEIAAAMRQNYPLRLPRQHPCQASASHISAADESHAHIQRRLAVGIKHTAKPRKPAQGSIQLVRLEVLDQVGQDQRIGAAMIEHSLFHETAAAESQLIKLTGPVWSRPVNQIGIEVNVDVLPGREFPHAWRSPRQCPRI